MSTLYTLEVVGRGGGEDSACTLHTRRGLEGEGERKRGGRGGGTSVHTTLLSRRGGGKDIKGT